MRRKYLKETHKTPNPYFTLRLKLMKESSEKYLVG